MMPLSLFRSRNFSTLNALTLLLYFAISGALYYLPFGFIRVGGYSAMQAGAALSPLALIVGFGAPLVGAIADRLNSRALLTFGPLVAACGFTILAFVDFKQPYWTSVFPPMVLMGLGMAITVPPLTSNVLKAAGKANAGIASGVNNAVARVAGLLAVATLGTVFFANFSFYFGGSTPEPAIRALNAVMRGETGASREAIAAFARALHAVMLVPATCAALASLAGWLWAEAGDVRNRE
jgi:predicted MFS family arabinose efflux permease